MKTNIDYSKYTVTVETDPSYYGSQCSPDEVIRLAMALSDRIEAELPGINVNLAQNKRVTSGPNEIVSTEIDAWISMIWTEIL